MPPITGKMPPAESVAMIDAACGKCKARYGWRGTVMDQPPCPKCGAASDLTGRENDHRLLEDFRAQLRAMRTKKEAAVAAIPVAAKVAYVKRAGQTRDHTCHWPGCGRQVPPAMWGCRTHWFRLPALLRQRIWAAYNPGQETDWSPTRAYVEAARAAQAWIAENFPETTTHEQE